MNRQPKRNYLWLMFNQHFSPCWSVICFTANLEATCRFNQCNQPRTDERCMMDDEHPELCHPVSRGINRGFCKGRSIRFAVAAGDNSVGSLSLQGEHLHSSPPPINSILNLPTEVRDKLQKNQGPSPIGNDD